MIPVNVKHRCLDAQHYAPPHRRPLAVWQKLKGHG
jgi:hypothetical protein